MAWAEAEALFGLAQTGAEEGGFAIGFWIVVPRDGNFEGARQIPKRNPNHKSAEK